MELELVKRSAANSIYEFFADREEPMDPRFYKIAGLNNLGEVVSAKDILDFIEDNKDEPWRIIGDYDNDGLYALYIAKKLLLKLGVTDIKARIPRRMSEGYGINDKIIDEIDSGVIMTVDNGIKAFDQIKKAKEKGLKVLLTDHHDLDDSGDLPYADIILNAHIPGLCTYTEYCGAGIVYKLAEALGDEEFLNEISTAAAIATVADCVELTGDNVNIFKKGVADTSYAGKGIQSVIMASSLYFRNLDPVKPKYPVLKGLLYLKYEDDTYGMGYYWSDRKSFSDEKGKNVTGVVAWAYADNKYSDEYYYDEETIGFKCSPLINAPGRLIDDGGDISLSVIDNDAPADKAEIKKLLSDLLEIYKFNEERKAIVEEIIGDLILEIELNGYQNDFPIVAVTDSSESGVMGIVASQISNTYKTPTIIFSDKGGNILTGSARSNDDLNIAEALNACKHLLHKYGGHPKAAGLSIKKENLDEFRTLINSLHKKPEMNNKVPYDLEITPEEISENAIELEEFKPFGEGNRPPVFLIRSFGLIPSIFDGKKIRYCSDGKTVIFNGIYSKAVAFGVTEEISEEVNFIDFIGTISMNRFNGKITPQVDIISILKIH